MKKLTITSFCLIAFSTLFVLLSGCSPDNNGNNNVVPNAPTGLNATLVNPSQVNLSWTDNATNESGYKIERKTANGSYALLGTTGSNITNFEDLAITPTAEYTYRVYAYNETGNSLQYSNEASINGNYSYLSTTPGNVWTYQETNNTTGNITTYTLTSTNRDTLINSVPHHVYTKLKAGVTTNEYYSDILNDYYQYTCFADSSEPGDLLYLNDSKQVGESLLTNLQIYYTKFNLDNSYFPIPGLSLACDLKNTIIDKDTSLTINGRTFTSVIKIKTEVINARNPLGIAEIPNIMQNISSYYSPNYGLIKQDFYLSIYPFPTSAPNNGLNQNKSTILLNATLN